jgi:hypothetical protein
MHPQPGINIARNIFSQHELKIFFCIVTVSVTFWGNNEGTDNEIAQNTAVDNQAL